MEEETSHKVEMSKTIDNPDVNTTSESNDSNNRACDSLIAPRIDDTVSKSKHPYRDKTYIVSMAMMEYDGEDNIANADPWSRQRFIRMTFMIVFVMLLITGICSGLVRLPGTRLNDFFVHYGHMIAMCFGILLIGLTCAFSCIAQTRYPPCIYFMLPIMVLCYTLITAAITVRYNTDTLLVAIAATVILLLVCLGLSFTPFDFTKWYAAVGFVMLGVFVAGLIMSLMSFILGTRMVLAQLILCIVSTAVLSICLIIELQMIMGGRTIEVDESEYLVAAFMVYSSVVSIFLHILQMINLLDMI